MTRNISTWRICGDRILGGAYWVADIEKFGKGTPLVEFVLCPPTAVPDPAAVGISNQGQSFISFYTLEGKEKLGVYDVVGSEYTPADFIEEGSRMGFSNRMGVNTDNPKQAQDNLRKFQNADFFAYLSHQAIINEPFLPAYHAERVMVNGMNVRWKRPCLKNVPEHMNLPVDSQVMCTSLHWENLPKEHGRTLSVNGMPRVVQRNGGSTTYIGALAPKGVKPTYTPGIFMMIPNPAQYFHVEIVADPENGLHEEVEKILRGAGTDLVIKLTDF